MIIPSGEYRYELRRSGELMGVEQATLSGLKLIATRTRAANERHEVEALLDEDGFIQRIKIRYERGPFSRSASYQCEETVIRGNVTAMAGAAPAEAKLGRFREVEAGDFLIFKALLVGHVRARGTSRWTGRVAVIDPATLIVRSVKRTCYQHGAGGLEWVMEPAIGEREQLQIDHQGRVVRHLDSRGLEGVLVLRASSC